MHKNVLSKMPNALTIAGSDSGGGAGIQADLKTFATLGVFGTSVITALTAQSGLGVTGIHAPSADFVALQLETVLRDFPIHGLKTGMLFNAEIIHSIAQLLAKNTRNIPFVLDPVCVSTSGHELIEKDAVEVMKKELFPLADLVTPNRPEAEFITGIAPNCEKSLQDIADVFIELGSKAVLIKGGHSPQKNDKVTDFFFEKGGKLIGLSQDFVETENTHGTGCTLSAAIVAYLCHKNSMQDAVVKAQSYINQALKYAYAPGKGIGPVNHLATVL